MIKILIIEDEIPARKKLKRFIDELQDSIEIVAELDTVSAAINFLQHNTVDLVFSDIELLDGNAFEIYNQVKINCPIIFTTAYNQFLMNAFETNGIEYLLKPFSKDRFLSAWKKFLILNKSYSKSEDILEKLNVILKHNKPRNDYKKRFTINSNQGIYFLEIEKITHFEAEEGVVFAFDNLGKKHIIAEKTLKDVELKLNPIDFFRINRSELINKNYLEKIERFNKNVLAIKIKDSDKFLKTSQSNTALFREWINK